jgi:thymidine kinase
MFSGKSSAALQEIRRNRVIGRTVLCVTHAIDTRYTEQPMIVSHNQEKIPAVALNKLEDLFTFDEFLRCDYIVIEEAQFFPDLKGVVLRAVDVFKKHVTCVGLDGDSNREPFGQILNLIPYCDSVRKFTALCTVCKDGTEAIFTYRKPYAPKEQVNVGGADQYEPRCRRHFLMKS